jgi:RimJ/RimL family protein N-acetyltransferase
LTESAVPVVVENLEPIRFDAATTSAPAASPEADWTTGLPVLKGRRLMLRELVSTDSLSLLSMLSTEEVAKFISPPPTTPQGFERFIAWAERERKAGNQFTFGMVPEGCDHAVGLVQVRANRPEILGRRVGICCRLTVLGNGLFSRARE